VQQSNIHKFLRQPVAQCFYIYYTKLPPVSAIHSGHLQSTGSYKFSRRVQRIWQVAIYAVHVDQTRNTLKMVRILGRNM